LLLHYEEGHWDFPKGRAEQGENEKETALREIREETGVQVEFVPGFRKEIDYFLTRGQEKVSKKVAFFLARALSRDVSLSFEHLDYKWLPFEKAGKQLTFKNARGLLASADGFLGENL
jgi:8-oxo-dGTP pyrophosphatase MutT (NUDIX family)